ncbi:glycosyltransferase [Desulfosediminicola flagellatus]|uniref:glycosyltransferase n=1 Tax=Desulfosediminicola flagellatus TaxID=2569541 RepID=UPI0010AD01EE|nr:glycosyltransferase [Desulfosediminicola flagellatus]
MKKKLLFISTIFPNKLSNQNATYSVHTLEGLKDYYDVKVVNPIPWHLKIKNNIQFHYKKNGISVYHPTLWYPPGVLRNYYGWFYLNSIKSCVSQIFGRDKTDLVFSTWLYPDGWAASKIAELYSIPSVLRAMGTDVNRLSNNNSVTTMTLEAISNARLTICVSAALRERLIHLGADSNKLEVLYNGIHREIFHKMDRSKVRDEFAWSEEETIVLYVGNLLKTKGLAELAIAYAGLIDNPLYSNARLVIAGEGPYRRQLLDDLKHYNVADRTLFMGNCPPLQIAKLMNSADVVCLPSYSEGRPNVVVEALGCNAKVVATAVGGTPELKKLHKNLYLIPAKDPQQLQQAIIKALNSPPYDDNAEDLYTWQDYSKKLANCFEK